MKRRPAPMEDRLRRWVRKRVVTRGERKRFADAIDRPFSWVSDYLNPDKAVHPDLDTTIRIVRAFLPELSWETVTDLPPLPEPDRLTRKLLSAWARVPVNRRDETLALVESLVDALAQHPSRDAHMSPPVIDGPESTGKIAQKRSGGRR